MSYYSSRQDSLPIRTISKLPPSRCRLEYNSPTGAPLTIYDNYFTTKNRRRNVFPKRQIYQENKPEVNMTSQLQIDAVRSGEEDIEKVEFIFLQKRALLKQTQDIHVSDKLFSELDGLKWLQRQVAVCS